MKLVELEPKWMTLDGKRIGLVFLCPKCKGALQDDPERFCYHVGVRFSNPLDDGEPFPRGWQRSGGDTFESITLSPSIQAMDGCKWHGLVVDGEVRTC